MVVCPACGRDAATAQRPGHLEQPPGRGRHLVHRHRTGHRRRHHGSTPLRTREVRMSRYSVPAQDPDRTVIVGWDNPLMTFFAQVFDPSIEDDEEACLLWIGTAPEAI